jgi:hypothetical protein
MKTKKTYMYVYYIVPLVTKPFSLVVLWFEKNKFSLYSIYADRSWEKGNVRVGVVLCMCDMSPKTCTRTKTTIPIIFFFYLSKLHTTQLVPVLSIIVIT